MATTITNAAAMSALIDFAVSNGFDDSAAITRCKAHLASLEKSAARQSGPTKQQRQNDNTIAKFVGYMRETGDSMSTAQLAAWLDANVEGYEGASVQKATALLTRARKLGFVERVTDGKKVVFSAVAA